jgi:flagellar basal-body rod protein FlgG
MDPALWVAKTGLDAQDTKLAVIANNLANISTTGFKKNRANFEDLLYQNVRQVGSQTSQTTSLPSGLQTGTGVRIVSTQKLMSQGNIIQTQNPLDVAINGRGYFQVLMPDGTIAYTRDGTFHLNENGQVVTSNGYVIQPAIDIPENAQSIGIGIDGTVTVVQPGNPVPAQIGILQLADFINPPGLQPVGENLFLETQSSGPPIIGDPAINGFGALQQGSLEASNVNAVEELVNMIETQRAYEMNTRAVDTTDQMLQFVTNNL